MIMVTGVCTTIFFDFFQIFLNIYEADTFLFFIQFIEKIKKNFIFIIFFDKLLKFNFKIIIKIFY